MESAQELFAMLADIRWGRHGCAPLTDRERLVFDPYCDGETETQIAARLGIRQGTVSYRLRKIIARFTTVKPRLARGVRPKRRDR
jgi:DNA-binding NarL/FixJ family response regulator